MSQREAAQVSLPEFQQRQKGWAEDMEKQWEIARWQIWHQYNLSPFIKPAMKPRNPKALVTFSWETPDNMDIPKGCEVTAEITELMGGIFEQLNKRNNG